MPFEVSNHRPLCLEVARCWCRRGSVDRLGDRLTVSPLRTMALNIIRVMRVKSDAELIHTVLGPRRDEGGELFVLDQIIPTAGGSGNLLFALITLFGINSGGHLRRQVCRQ